jgi:hypothetical protein
MECAKTHESCHSKPSSPSRIGNRRTQVQRTLPFAVLGALWCMLTANLSQHWAANPQYSFGWLVPVICVYLFTIRWRTRPPAGLENSAIARWAFWTAGFAVLPTWLALQSNPDWRFMSWVFAAEVVLVSLCAIYFIGGNSWLRHFAFSVCFMFASVPWSASVEGFVTQGLA